MHSRSIPTPWPLLLASFVLGHAAPAQDPPRADRTGQVEGHPTGLLVLDGIVLAADGSPAEGAVVVSSAGGKAITDGDGSYRLEVDVPREATSVQLTAVGRAGGNQVASSSVALNRTGSTTRVDPLTLSPGSSCSPSWLPTFGGEPGTNGPVNALTVYDDG